MDKNLQFIKYPFWYSNSKISKGHYLSALHSRAIMGYIKLTITPIMAITQYRCSCLWGDPEDTVIFRVKCIFGGQKVGTLVQ